MHLILQDNVEQLIAQNMLEKGHGRSLAEAEIGTLLDLIQLFDGANLELDADQDSLSMNLVLLLDALETDNEPRAITVRGQDASHD